VAHRDPISFVLVAANSSSSTTTNKKDTNAVFEDDEMCTISSSRTMIHPTNIVPGMIVDYLGRQLDIISSSSANDAGLIVTPTATTLKKEEDNNNDEKDKLLLQRPIFVPIPKISDIGLIDSPLITGITAIDALTPIGKGQNMLIISTDDENANESSQGDHNNNIRLNKRGWMINLLRNVITNHRHRTTNDANKKKSEIRSFYCLTSTDPIVRTQVLNDISSVGIRNEVITILSSSTSSSSSSNDGCIGAAEAVAAAASACTLAEHHALTTGGDAIVIIDDINLHKTLWDITTRELVHVYGTQSVVEADLNGGSSSEMRGYFSGLIQRAARFNTKRGGGSVTLLLLSTLPNPNETDMDDSEDNDATTYDASDFDDMSEKIRTRIRLLVSAKVPLTAANLRKIKLPIPRPSAAEDQRRLALQHIEDLISMSDGQVWLDVSMAGRSPPLDPSRSITRVGVGADTLTCRADAPALRSVVGSLRFEFQQALDLSPNTVSSSSSSSKGIAGIEEDNDNTRQVRRRDAFLLAMHQEVHEGRKLSHECTLLLAASRGHLDGVLAKGGKAGTSMGRKMIEGLLEYVTNETQTGEIIRSIDETLDLSSEGRDLLENAIVVYFSKSLLGK
jgi:F-type H+-transporting ATPase subunit alpha